MGEQEASKDEWLVVVVKEGKPNRSKRRNVARGTLSTAFLQPGQNGLDGSIHDRTG